MALFVDYEMNKLLANEDDAVIRINSPWTMAQLENIENPNINWIFVSFVFVFGAYFLEHLVDSVRKVLVKNEEVLCIARK